MCEWACQGCGEAYLSNPPEIGLCTACQQDDQHDDQAEVVMTGEDD
jgi:hypothetical protein